MEEIKPKIKPMIVKRPMTRKQLETIEFLSKFTKENKRRPTIYEVMGEFNLKSTCSAWERIKRAEYNIKKCPFCNKSLQKASL